jgi:CheY-like chemotaxis protein/HPt (histidine-containing phosphotransfer) domain-containing protein
LLAEDHPVNRTVLGHQLEYIGFQFDVAEDGMDAYEHWLTGRYALILTDLNMPRMDGYTLARRIREHELQNGSARTPMIALSANVMQGEPEKCREAGMDDFAAKPTTIPVLAARLRKWLPHVEWAEAEPARAQFAAATTMVDGDVIDSVALEELTGGDPTLAATLFADFLESSRADAAALSSALEQRDAPETRRQAHRVKGAARIVGAREIASVAARIEAATDAPVCDWALVGELAEQLERQLGRLNSALT